MSTTLKRALCLVAAVVLCAGTLLFLQRFSQSEPAASYPAWDEAAAVGADGTRTPLDPAALPSGLAEGGHCEYAATLPQDRPEGEMLVFETSALELRVFLDGQLIWSSNAPALPGVVSQGQAHVPLPSGGGERLVMEFVPTGEDALVPPVARLMADPSDQAGAIAYANYYAIPAGATALVFVLVGCLFLLGVAEGRHPWRLLLPALAAACLTAHGLSLGFGTHFLGETAAGALASPAVELVALAALAAFLATQRDRAFWRALVVLVALSVGALVLATALSWARGGYLARLMEELLAQLQMGYLSGTLYWLTWWLALACAALSGWQLARSISLARQRERALALRSELTEKGYRALEQRLRADAAERHERRHRLTALEAMVGRRDWEGIEDALAAWRKTAGEPASFSENLAVNAVLQDAATRAREAGVKLTATALVPRELGIPDEDLCQLLMNMLDNALEGAERTPEPGRREVLLDVRVRDGFLVVSCENSFDGQVSAGPDGLPHTTKPEPELHGFGLEQMRAIAERHGSVLDLTWDDERFYARTALQLPAGAEPTRG